MMVRTQRRDLDQYFTPTRMTEILLEHVPIYGKILEPTAGDGKIAKAFEGRFITEVVWMNDIDEKFGHPYRENAADPDASIWKLKPDWVVANPPFKLAFPILKNAYESALYGVAFLLRLTFMEPTLKRFQWFNEHRFEQSHHITFGSPRPSFTDDGNTDTVTAAWFVWSKTLKGSGCQMIYASPK